MCVLFEEQLSGCQRGMIYKVETSLKCAGVCGRGPGGEGERRKMQMGLTERLAGAAKLGGAAVESNSVVLR